MVVYIYDAKLFKQPHCFCIENDYFIFLLDMFTPFTWVYM